MRGGICLCQHILVVVISFSKCMEANKHNYKTIILVWTVVQKKKKGVVTPTLEGRKERFTQGYAIRLESSEAVSQSDGCGCGWWYRLTT